MAKKETITKQLEHLALRETFPFCYLCYIEAPTGKCDKCGSDDLMRLHKETGCEYGVDWYIPEILERELLKPVDEEETFENMIEDCYSTETKIGWLKLSTVNILKTMDEISWDIAKDEYISSLEQDEEIISFDDGLTYYWVSDIESMIEEKLEKEVF